MPYADPARRKAYYLEHKDTWKRTRPDGPDVPPDLLHLDPAPLLALVDEVVALSGGERREVLRAKGLSEREIFRMRAAGRVSLRTADQYCCKLGTTLGRLWPQWWELDEKEAV